MNRHCVPIVALVLLLAACGDDGTAPTTATTTTAAGTTQASSTTEAPTTTAPPTTTTEAPTTTWSAPADAGLAWARLPDTEGVFGRTGDQEIVAVVRAGPGLVSTGMDDSGGDVDPAAWVSADGYTWARVDPAVFAAPGDQWVKSMAAAGPGLVAVGVDESGGDRDAAVWVSADGYTWTRVPHDEAVFGGPRGQEMFGVTAGGPGVVAVGTDTSNAEGEEDGVVWVSEDGYTWARLPQDDAVFGGEGEQWLRGVTAGGPGLVAGGWDTAGPDRDAAVWVSADGYTWERVPHDEAVFGGLGLEWIESVTAGGPGLVAVGVVDETSDDKDGGVWVSVDGYTWTRVGGQVALGGTADQWIMMVVALGTRLVAVGSDGADEDADAALWVSEDGYSWVRIADPAVFGGPGGQWIDAVAVGPPGMVAVGADWLTQSDPVVWVSPPPGG